MFEIKDLAGLSGLSEPITKLVESVSKGLGVLYEPTHVRRMAKAEVFRKRCLNDVEAELTGDSYALEVLISKEVKKQINIDSIVHKAIEFISENESISEESVDEDWMTRFIDISQNISNEEMQNLWAKILSDEVSKPNSYSLRTLELLKNLSSNEAKLFVNFTKLGFILGGRLMVVKSKEFLESYNILLNDQSLLQELNLIDSNFGYSIDRGEEIIVDYCGKKVFIKNNSIRQLKFSVLITTKIGNELNGLIDKTYDEQILRDIANAIRLGNRSAPESVEIYFINENSSTSNNEEITYTYI